jgi:muramoyltetrapeptide carboxypeptidase
VAPAGNVKPAEIEEGIELLKGAGFRVKLGEHLFGKFRYFSGTVEQRVSDIHSFLSDLDIAAIYAVRGGSGSSQLLPHLNFEKWQQIKKFWLALVISQPYNGHSGKYHKHVHSLA